MTGAIKNMVLYVITALLGSASLVFAASDGESGGSGILIALFLAFGALVILFQLIPGLILFFSMVKGLFVPGEKEKVKVAGQQHGRHG